MACDVASGLAFLHGHQPPVLHRDLKPDNLLFDEGAVCKISDLGGSRLEDECRTMTAGTGTPVFCAPEQLAHQRYTTAVDVWAAGCVFTCLYLDARLPYIEAEEGLLGRVVRGEERPWLPSDCPMHLEVARCCQFEPAQRISAEQLSAGLAELAPLDERV